VNEEALAHWGKGGRAVALKEKKRNMYCNQSNHKMKQQMLESQKHNCTDP
jgi:hypothetical protein